MISFHCTFENIELDVELEDSNGDLIEHSIKPTSNTTEYAQALANGGWEWYDKMVDYLVEQAMDLVADRR